MTFEIFKLLCYHILFLSVFCLYGANLDWRENVRKTKTTSFPYKYVKLFYNYLRIYSTTITSNHDTTHSKDQSVLTTLKFTVSLKFFTIFYELLKTMVLLLKSKPKFLRYVRYVTFVI